MGLEGSEVSIMWLKNLRGKLIQRKCALQILEDKYLLSAWKDNSSPSYLSVMQIGVQRF